MYKPVVLVVLDGWGIGKGEKGNAIAQANTPTIKKLNDYYPHIALQASGVSVGLPWGEVGNSEVGHMTLGAGRIVYQNMPRITMAIQNGDFFRNPAILGAINHARQNNSAVHIMGLIGKGSVHSYIDHLYAILETLHEQKFEKVFIHMFTDGRDSSPTSAINSLRELQKKLDAYHIGKIATVCGRYFAMDRNNNWDRIEKSYRAMVFGEGAKITSIAQYLEQSYAKKVFDEYMEPAVVVEKDKPIGQISSNDSIIFFNFREDRARQMTHAFVSPDFDKFKKGDLENIKFVTLTQYEDGIPTDVAFPPSKSDDHLGKVLSQNGLSQLRIAETEKFAHVTYFFNGGIEKPCDKEDRKIIPSVDVASFDAAPEMSAQSITDYVIQSLPENNYDFILINYANADIVGHTGKMEATIKAIEKIDNCLSQLIPKVLEKNGCLLITADHGNAEELINSITGEVDTEHSTNPVPLWFVTPNNHKKEPQIENIEHAEASGLLSDMAPTVLDLLNIPKSEEMTGESLLPILQ